LHLHFSVIVIIFLFLQKNSKAMVDFFKYQDANVTVCDSNATIIYMNANAQASFGDVTGKSLYDCHPSYAGEKIRKMLTDGIPNAYTISKKGCKKMIYQTAWRTENGGIGGLIEYSFVIPEEMPHFKRD
jgi:transcriptional regulator with PAS, ATPase and Fis domain